MAYSNAALNEPLLPLLGAPVPPILPPRGGFLFLVEVAGSHAIYVSKPKDVAALVKKAVQSVSAKVGR